MLGGVAYTLMLGPVPAPPPLVEAVQEITIDSAIEEASVLRIRFGITKTLIGDWSILDLDPFRPLLPLGVRIQQGISPPEAVINGFVTDHHVTYSDTPGGSSLEVTAMDATFVMNLTEKVTPWPNLPDAAIAAAIFGQNAIIPQVDQTSPVLVEPEGMTIQRGTDIRFLRRLARRNGFDCFVQPEPLSGLDIGHFGRRQLVGLPQAALNVSFGGDTNVKDFSVRYELAKPTMVIAAQLDETTKTPQLGLAPASLLPPLGLEPTLLRELPPSMVRPTGTGLTQTADLQQAAQAVVDRSTWAVVAEGAVGQDVAVLRPGGLVAIRGVGRLYNGNWFVTRVRHTIAAGRYEQRFEATRNAVTETGAEVYLELPA
ncbi:MAG: phage late control D family protein [Actinomycetota bacterium]|nr:phage late control D family protein [Actinomycetota bacterium]